MKHNIKLVLAILLAAMMIVASFSAIADAGDAAKDLKVKITGLDAGDNVYLYQVIYWADGQGWTLNNDFSSLSSNTTIASILNNDQGTIELSKSDLEEITTAVKSAIDSNSTTLAAITTSGSVGSNKDSYEAEVAVGMYLALVKPHNADTLYNPMIVSADFNTTNGTEEIASSETMGASTVAKKDTVTVEKVTEDMTLDAGEPVKFTITTTIPAFSDSYVDPWFKLSDTMDPGLALYVDSTHEFTIDAGEVTTWTFGADGKGSEPAKDDTSFIINFDSTQIAALETPQTVTVEYYAYITDTTALTDIVEKDNYVEVSFPNNPKDDSGHGHQYDEVREYTFSIDAKILGNSSYTASELVKVGVDKNGNTILESKQLSNESWHDVLPGAKFKLYTKSGEKYTEYTNPALTAATSASNGYIVSDNDGLLYIPGLDVGTYYIHEEDAPDGFIKDTEYHAFTIAANFDTETLTKTLGDGCTVSYEVKYLKDYTVTYGNTESKYEFTNEGPHVSISTIGDSSSEIINTKGVELPSTGGVGTTIFYVGGSIMVLAAAILLITKRRMGVED